MAQPNPAITLQADPTGLAPERLLVLDVTGPVTDFAKAAERIEGLQFVGEEVLDGDELDPEPQLYLLVPDLHAIGNILSLWDRWQQNLPLQRGFAPWGHLFEHLRDIRPWGPSDRVRPVDRSLLQDLVDGVADDEIVRLECELVFRSAAAAATAGLQEVTAKVAQLGGEVVHSARYAEFGYHGVLIDLPAAAVRSIVELDPSGLAGLEPIQSIYPQSVGTSIELVDPYPAGSISVSNVDDTPIAAVLDAVPLQAHPWLAPWLSVVDPLGLDALAVGRRVHGTAMASIVIHGDRSAGSDPIKHRIYFRSVMYAPAPGGPGGSFERFLDDRLVVDVIAEAVTTMRQNGGQQVVLVNVSLGDANKRFADRLSPWARALDYLAYRYGILFVVATGNINEATPVATFNSSGELEAAGNLERSNGIIGALNDFKADRRLLSPSESLNSLTVGAWHSDAMVAGQLPVGKLHPYPEMTMPNFSSALGLGHRRSVKPDILLPGGREHLNVLPGSTPASVRPHGGSSFGGINVAAPGVAGGPVNSASWTVGSSAAAAMASHAAHRAYDELEREYPEDFSPLSLKQKACLLKALVAHPATWRGADSFIAAQVVPAGTHWETARREIVRHLGYGFVLPDDVIACAADRATLWAAGTLLTEEAREFTIPVPAQFSQNDDKREVRVTLAWLTPVRPGRQYYRAAKLRAVPLGDNARASAGVNTSMEPPWQQTESGTLSHRRWEGSAFGLAGATGTISLQIQREKDQGEVLDDAIPFGLIVSVAMEDNAEVYAGILNRVAVRPASLVQVPAQ